MARNLCSLLAILAAYFICAMLLSDLLPQHVAGIFSIVIVPIVLGILAEYAFVGNLASKLLALLAVPIAHSIWAMVASSGYFAFGLIAAIKIYVVIVISLLVTSYIRKSIARGSRFSASGRFWP